MPGRDGFLTQEQADKLRRDGYTRIGEEQFARMTADGEAADAPAGSYLVVNEDGSYSVARVGEGGQVDAETYSNLDTARLAVVDPAADEAGLHALDETKWPKQVLAGKLTVDEAVKLADMGYERYSSRIADNDLTAGDFLEAMRRARATGTPLSEAVMTEEFVIELIDAWYDKDAEGLYEEEYGISDLVDPEGVSMEDRMDFGIEQSIRRQLAANPGALVEWCQALGAEYDDPKLYELAYRVKASYIDSGIADERRAAHVPSPAVAENKSAERALEEVIAHVDGYASVEELRADLHGVADLMKAERSDRSEGLMMFAQAAALDEMDAINGWEQDKAAIWSALSGKRIDPESVDVTSAEVPDIDDILDKVDQLVAAGSGRYGGAASLAEEIGLVMETKGGHDAPSLGVLDGVKGCVDGRGNVALAVFDTPHDADAVVYRPRANEFVVAHGYDMADGTWSHGTYFGDDAARAWECANPDIMEGASVRWTTDDVADAVRDRVWSHMSDAERELVGTAGEVEAPADIVNDVRFDSSDMHRWRDAAVEMGLEMLYRYADENTERYMASKEPSHVTGSRVQKNPARADMKRGIEQHAAREETQGVQAEGKRPSRS